MCQTVLGLLNILSSVCDGGEGNAIMGGARKRIAKALEDLHTNNKTVENNELLLVSEPQFWFISTNLLVLSRNVRIVSYKLIFAS